MEHFSPKRVVLKLGSNWTGFRTFPSALPEVVGLEQLPELPLGRRVVLTAVLGQRVVVQREEVFILKER